METEGGDSNESSRLHIDLNEVPISLPGEEVAVPVAMVELPHAFSVCSGCGAPAVSPVGESIEQTQQDWKCFQCLLRNGGSEGGVGGDGRPIDINASPPREAETERERKSVDQTADVAVLVRRDPLRDRAGNSKIQALDRVSLSSHCTTSTPSDLLCADNKYNNGKTSCDARSTNILGFEGTLCYEACISEWRHKSSNYPGLENSPESPNMVYLQILREYISERKGVLGEGWHVEFEYCAENHKTCAFYVGPDGTRHKTMGNVACHLGLSLGYPCVETQKLPSELVKEAGRFPAVGNSQQRQNKGAIDGPNNRGDGFPIQFQDFFLISAGNIDPRPSYHNSDHIWPVGYRSSWHDKITGSIFVCDVADGGESGPAFKVQRYPCTRQSLPICATVLSGSKLSSCNGDDRLGKDDSAISQVVDDESVSVHMTLNEHSPPSLDDDISTLNKGKEAIYSVEANSSMITVLQRSRTKEVDILGPKDNIGEFQVEGNSSSSAWEMVSKDILSALHKTYKQKGAFPFPCTHITDETNTENLESLDSLSKFSCLTGPLNIPQPIKTEDEYNAACEMLLTWLRQDRFGLDAEFVQEILEKLPGVTACSGYKSLNDRKHKVSPQTVGSGFLQPKRKLGDPESDSSSGNYKKARLQLDDSERDPCPPGKPLSSKLAAYLIGDALQVWELAWHFFEALGLAKPFSFEELESEVISPWLGSYSVNNPEHETLNRVDKVVFPARLARFSRCTGSILAKTHGSLLNLLVPELLSKVAVHIWPNFDSGEYKSRKGRKKDKDWAAALERAKHNMLPVNELTWPEIARRYILAVLSMEGNLDSTEIASRESGKVFHCLRGDGGTLCGSLTGIAALEADAAILADATKQIFGSLKGKSEVVTIYVKESDTNSDSQTIEASEGVLPKWAQLLEPVRKLPTNVGNKIKLRVNAALAQDGVPESVRKTLEHSISKEVYKSNAAGPTKRAVISVLANVSREIPEPKAEKKETGNIIISLSGLIMKQCRIVLRSTAAADEGKVFCNLLGKTILRPNDNDDKGLLGYPGMVPRPLDFRTIDLRLAGGAYGGSHEAFVDDVREVYNNIRTAYKDQSDLIGVAEKLSEKFEDLYEKEVIALIHKLAEFGNVDNSSGEAAKEREDFIASLYAISIPKAPWDDGICKVCGMDRDDDSVLLCDRCDSEYHTYCLNPPLLKIPRGNWFCPSCVEKSISGNTVHNDVVYQPEKRRNEGEFVRTFLESVAHFAEILETREYWDFTVDERIFVLKFMFDELLKSATVHDHIDQRASQNSELQQKLCFLYSELEILQSKEEKVASKTEKANFSISSFSSRFSELEDPMQLDEQNDYSKRPGWPRSTSNPVKHCPSSSQAEALGQLQLQEVAVPSQQENIFPHENIPKRESFLNELPVSSVQRSSFISAGSLTPGNHFLELASSSNDDKNDVSSLQSSIASLESELLKVSIRKEFLGRDSNGRVYWAFCSANARPWIVANGSLTSKKRVPEEFIEVPDSATWMSYASESEIEKLLCWLQESIETEKELMKSISQCLSTICRDSYYDESRSFNEPELSSSMYSEGANASLGTNAMAALEKKYGPCLEMNTPISVHKNVASLASPDAGMCRCECLELLWPSKEHCPSCHQSFATGNELSQHYADQCTLEASTSERSLTTEETSNHKKSQNVSSEEKYSGGTGIAKRSTSERPRDGLSFIEPECPFNMEDIKAKFVVQNSTKELVKDVGLKGSGGIRAFIQNEFSYPGNPALTLGARRENEVSSGEMTHSLNKQQESSSVPGGIYDMKNNQQSRNLLRCEENAMRAVGSTDERDQVSTIQDKGRVLAVSRSSIVPSSSLRPLVGFASEILRFLKISLLDMDAALPEESLRISRSNHDRRRAWRRFVKSANTIYEMTQALIILEDAIKSDYLRSDWWYWSSPSTAAKVSTLSALSLRLYTLDAAIIYERPFLYGTMKDSITESAVNNEDSIPGDLVNSSRMSKSDFVEKPKSRRRISKWRND